jgi:NADPH-dependent 2,4-dienoyl-CoA reductase/sulfur reductase-like enzyme
VSSDVSHGRQCVVQPHTCVVCVPTGRRPYTTGLGLDNVGIIPNKRGQIEVNDHFRTQVPSIYAIGDCIPGAAYQKPAVPKFWYISVVISVRIRYDGVVRTASQDHRTAKAGIAPSRWGWVQGWLRRGLGLELSRDG